jgi:hypothetical protein
VVEEMVPVLEEMVVLLVVRKEVVVWCVGGRAVDGRGGGVMVLRLERARAFFQLVWGRRSWKMRLL